MQTQNFSRSTLSTISRQVCGSLRVVAYQALMVSLQKMIALDTIPLDACNYISQKDGNGVVRWVKTSDCGQAACSTSGHYVGR